MKATEVAQRLGISAAFLGQMIRSGKIKAKKVKTNTPHGYRYEIEAASIKGWKRTRAVKPAAAEAKPMKKEGRFMLIPDAAAMVNRKAAALYLAASNGRIQKKTVEGRLMVAVTDVKKWAATNGARSAASLQTTGNRKLATHIEATNGTGTDEQPDIRKIVVKSLMKAIMEIMG